MLDLFPCIYTMYDLEVQYTCFSNFLEKTSLGSLT